MSPRIRAPRIPQARVCILATVPFYAEAIGNSPQEWGVIFFPCAQFGVAVEVAKALHPKEMSELPEKDRLQLGRLSAMNLYNSLAIGR
jgi:hypothetical protein